MFGLGFDDGWTLAPRRPAARSHVALPSYASVVTFGDSIAYGEAASNGATTAWAPLLAGEVGAALSNKGIAGTVLQNSADSGGSARGNNGRNRFQADLTGANLKQAVFIAYGYNDARYTAAPTTLNVTNFGIDYREVLNGLRLLGYAREDIYVLAPYYVTDTGLITGSGGFSGQSRSGYEAFVAAAEDVAREFGVRFCNLYDELNTPAWIADLDGNDHIHPTDVGHALIFQAIRDRTHEPNTRAAPPTVFVAGGAGSVSFTVEPVPGAVSYEYALVSGNGRPLPFSTVRTVTAAIVSAASGSYYGKARAVFGDGSKGPWTFSASEATATAATGLFVQDSFTDQPGVFLTDHWPEIGGAWELQTGETSALAPRITADGRVYPTSNTGTWRNKAETASADYYVEAELDHLSAIANNVAGVAGRMDAAGRTYYCAFYSGFSGNWIIQKRVAGGALTTIGTPYNSPFTSGSRTLRLRMQGTSIKLFLDGVERVSAIDSAITGAGRAGLFGNMGQGATTGIHCDSFVAETL